MRGDEWGIERMRGIRGEKERMVMLLVLACKPY
jgi:hypothetical protein